MKKIILALILCVSLIVNTGCSVLLISSILSRASKRVTDPNEYGEFHKSVEVPEYYPESISSYTVNDYCYVIEKDSSLYYEIFVDVSLSNEEFTKLISSVTADSRSKKTKSAFHSPDFQEIVFFDEYEFTSQTEPASVVGAHIEKVIYNEAEARIIFVLLYVEQYSYYPAQGVEFFKKLNISPEEYSAKNNNSI